MAPAGGPPRCVFFARRSSGEIDLALLVYTQKFVDEQERPAPAPGTEAWAATLRNTVLFTEEAPDRTRVPLTTEPEGEAAGAEIEAFVLERMGMTRGWTGSFDALEALLEG